MHPERNAFRRAIWRRESREINPDCFLDSRLSAQLMTHVVVATRDPREEIATLPLASHSSIACLLTSSPSTPSLCRRLVPRCTPYSLARSCEVTRCHLDSCVT